MSSPPDMEEASDGSFSAGLGASFLVSAGLEVVAGAEVAGPPAKALVRASNE